MSLPHGSGWYQIAFVSEITRPVFPAAIGRHRLAIIRSGGRTRVVDAICPHRGADLAYGGRLDGDAIICPFHGFRIGIDTTVEHGLRVREHETLELGGLLFVRLGEGADNGFSATLHMLAETRSLVPGFTMRLDAAADMIIENAFDQAHFRPVHGIGLESSFRMMPSDRGELAVEGSFDMPPSPWQRGREDGRPEAVPFRARAFSPGLIVSDLGGAYPYTVITAATPVPDGGAIIRLSLALERDPDGQPPRSDLVDFLLRRSREGLEKDRMVWEHRAKDHHPVFTNLDGPVRAFREFCDGFGVVASG